jgi:hypothetical protein
MPPVTPKESADANFRFLLSDEANAINDFLSLDVVISRIGIHQGGESGKWLEFSPQESKVDLTKLQGANAQVIWSGNLDPGTYTKVFIFVDKVTGVLAATNQQVDLKLPSGKLQMSVPFEVTGTSVTDFVYDVAVVAAGSGRKKPVKYILKLQISQSGTDKQLSVIKGRKGDKELNLKLEGEAMPGQEVSLMVRLKGTAVRDAKVVLDGTDVGVTGADGRIVLALPHGATQVKINVSSGGLERELEIEFAEAGKAVVASEEKGSAAGEESPAKPPAVAGTFLLFITQPGGQAYSGKTVTFKIGDLQATETSTWQQGGVEVINLTASSTAQGDPAAGVLATPPSQPQPPHVFMGTATVDGKPAPEGTVITALVDGVAAPDAVATVAVVPAASAAGLAKQALAPLGANLLRVWRFDAAKQEWTFYDPSPAFASYNTVKELVAGQFYYIVTKDGQNASLNGQQRALFDGWNPVVW